MTKRSRAPLLALPSLPPHHGVRAGIYETCLAAIRDGTLAAGGRLPSSRQLAADWHVARNTVDDALAQLQAEGLVVRRVGDGTFVAASVVARSEAARPRHRKPAKAGRRALAMASTRGAVAARQFVSTSTPRPLPFMGGLADVDAFPVATWRRLSARCWRSAGAALLAYLPPSGYPPLQSAIANHLATARGIRCVPEQVMILNGAMQAVDISARVLGERDDVAWIEDPCYPNLRAVLAMAGMRVAPIAVDAQGLAIDRAAGAGPGLPTLIVVTPSCHYPTGVAMSLARRLALLRVAGHARAWIVEDDHQAEFVWSGRPVTPIFALDRSARTLYVGTFSHTIFPSLRIAYVVLPTALIDVFHAVRRQLDDHTHGPLQAVLADFIAGGHFAAHLRRMRALYASRRDALLAAFARHAPHAALGGTGCGMHATLELPAGVADTDEAVRAARTGIRVQPLSRYSAGPGRSNGFLIGYAALSERRIGPAVARLARVLDDRERARRR